MGTMNWGKLAVRNLQKGFGSLGWQKYKVEPRLAVTLLQFMLTGSPGYSKSSGEEEGHVCLSLLSCLNPSPSWEGEASLKFFKTCQYQICARENGFPSCAQWTFASKEAYTTIAGGGVMSFNATAKAISRDKFSADRGSHRCCRTLSWGGGILGTCQPTCHQCWQGPRPQTGCSRNVPGISSCSSFTR